MSMTIVGPGSKTRCHWRKSASEFLIYHDTNRGTPVSDVKKLCLEGFQSGLSWRTILARRVNFQANFHLCLVSGIQIKPYSLDTLLIQQYVRAL